MSVVAVALLAPFLAALAGFAVGRARPRLVAPIGCAGTGVALLATAALALADVTGAPVDERWHGPTAPTGTVPFALDLRLDGLAALVSLAVGVVAFLVQLYSVDYLRGDPRYSSYAAFVSLFTAAMLLVVFADDLIVLLVGWEVMGICSYFLIGHHWEQEDARAGAVKAIIVTRVGDVPFLFGIFTLGIAAGSFEVDRLLAWATDHPGRTVTVATLLLLCGVVGKSAQFPLHTWLPDAMAGPTPISALIHAATMVAAGIYLVARLYDAFVVAPATLAVMAVIATVTMLGAALAAFAQRDIKRVLAYSTVSQLAYMLGALAAGSVPAATFHLLTHAAFKALLFLAAGSVIHAMGTNQMSDMGGLRRAMPVTFVTMTLGLAALAGVPPLSGFFSKETVIGAAEDAALGDEAVASWAGWLLLVGALLTVVVTAAYVTRAWLMTFFDSPRSTRAAHEAPPLMRWPLVALAVPTVLLGFLYGPLPDWLGDASGGAVLSLSGVTVALGLLGLAVGAAGTVVLWRRAPAADPADVLGGARPWFDDAFKVDALYDLVLVRPVRALARGVRWGDEEVVGAYVRGSGTGARLAGGLLRLVQNGNVQGYLTILLAGVVVMAIGASLT